MTAPKHTPPELEAVELNGAWFVRTKPRTPDGTPEIVADLSMARHGREWATLFAASQKMREALKPFAEYERVRSTMGGNTPREGGLFQINSSAGHAEITVEDMERAIAALAAAEGRTEEKEG